MIPVLDTLNFTLPPELEASEPPEARGLQRDEVRLAISYLSDNRIAHTHFRNLDEFLNPGDLIVINTSGTLNASLPALRSDGSRLELHLSTRLPANLWIVELRQPGEIASQPFYDVHPGETLNLPENGLITILSQYHPDTKRLWIATLRLPTSLVIYLTHHGEPIRYSYVKKQWPIAYYQTIYATEPGSAEMPSAGRGFTSELMTRLLAKGIEVAPLILHTGVSSSESHEPPYEEYYRVSASSARHINHVRQAGGRIIAVGTTVVRALETVTDANGITHPGEGWTDIVITPARGIRSVDSMLTGLHEPKASHLAMLESLAGRDHLHQVYQAVINEGYFWHEFGDLHLLLSES